MSHRFPVVAAGALVATLGLAACGSASSGAEAKATQKCTPTVENSSLITPGTLTDVVNATLPPMAFVKPGGELDGMRVELIRMLAKNLCLKVKFVNTAFDPQIPGLAGHRWDVVGSGAFYTEERANLVKLVPYEVQDVAISAPKGNPKGIAKVEDLSGLKVAVEAPGYEYTALSKVNDKLKADGKAQFTLQGFNTTTEAYQAMVAGQVDAVGIIGAVVDYYSKKGNFTTAVRGISPAPLALGFEDRKLADASADALNRMRDDGSMKKLFDEYGAQMWTGKIAVTTGPLTVGEKTS